MHLIPILFCYTTSTFTSWFYCERPTICYSYCVAHDLLDWEVEDESFEGQGEGGEVSLFVERARQDVGSPLQGSWKKAVTSCLGSMVFFVTAISSPFLSRPSSPA